MSNYANLAYLDGEPHYVYVVWNGDTPVYAGMTSDWRSRTSVHAKAYLDTGRATHIDAWHVGHSRAEAEAVEADTIRALDPADNVQHSPRAEAQRQAWMEYSAWLDAWHRAISDPAFEWALDPEIARRVCHAVGYEPPTITVEQRRAEMVAAAERLVRHL